MIVALDKDFNRIHIEDAAAKQEYYCPYCGERLFQRKGEVRRHHFAHMPGKVCKDTWEATYDMSDWHYDWQNSFPKANQEVLLSMGEIKHRADVLIGRTVTEFQSCVLMVLFLPRFEKFGTIIGDSISVEIRRN